MWSCEVVLGLFRVDSIYIVNRLTMSYPALVPQTKSDGLFLDRTFTMLGDLGPETLYQHEFTSERVVGGMLRVLQTLG